MTAPTTPTEAECQQTIIDAARMLGYRVHAERAARTAKSWRTPVQGDAGWPDLVICGHGRIMFVELKRRPNRVGPQQRAWLDALDDAHMQTLVIWVPEGQQAFVDRLAAVARDAEHRNAAS